MKKVFLLAALLLSMPLLAADGDATSAPPARKDRFYLFGSVGQSDLPAMTSLKETVGSSSTDATESRALTSGKAGVGVMLNNNVAIEAYYADFGRYEYRAATANGMAKQKTTIKGVGAQVVFFVPVDEDNEIFLNASVGLAKITTTDNVTLPTSATTTCQAEISADRQSAAYGLGLSYRANRRISLFADYSVYSMLMPQVSCSKQSLKDEQELRVMSVGLRGHF